MALHICSHSIGRRCDERERAWGRLRRDRDHRGHRDHGDHRGHGDIETAEDTEATETTEDTETTETTGAQGRRAVHVPYPSGSTTPIRFVLSMLCISAFPGRQSERNAHGE